MSQFWKPGTEKPGIIDDEEGGVLFFSASPSFSSGYSNSSLLFVQQMLTLDVFLYQLLLHSLLGILFFTIFIVSYQLGVSRFVLVFGTPFSILCRYGFASIDKQRQRLPVYKYRTAILYLVETHATTIIVGETGSGKTTQIPQVFFY